MSLTPAFLDELRARTSLSALVGKSVKLTKAGREHKGCCPFHNEKTPSFYVNDDKGFYHCFGCSAHGDAIRWMTDQRGLPFIDAVKELAAAAGMEMPVMDKRAAQKAERAKSLHDVMQAAADWFAAQLGGLDGAEARALLERRGVADATRRAFGIGYAPDSRSKLRTALRDFGDAMLVEAGLLIQVEGKEPYDRFRGRLMIPILDVRGKVIAFGGRIIGEGEPKYLNSPDTPLFDKGRTLYNLDRAAAAARKADRVFVVEGYMDAIALAQAGVAEAVAPLGTALTEHQLERLWRMVDVPTLCLDGDGAGQKAAIRAAHRALPLLTPGKSLSFVTLPDGQDPDDVVRKGGAAAFEALAREPEALVDRLWKHELASIDTSSPDGRAALQRNLNALAETISDRLVATEYKRSFKDLFWGTFGWKPRDVAGVRKAMEGWRSKNRVDPIARLWRAILLGLSHYPKVLHSEVEILSHLEVGDRYLARWRDILIDAALAKPTLDVDLIETILAQSDVSPIEKADLTRDLPFTFVRKDASPSEAERDLTDVIHIIDREQRLRDEIKETHERFARTLSEADWLRHRSLVLAQHDIEERHRSYIELAREAA